MPDRIFEDPRLVAIYDAFDGDRRDLIPYLWIVEELRVKSVLDVGSGTGCFACLLGERGIDVTGLEPAEASLEFARSKPGADKVKWIHGSTMQLPPMAVDMAVMTGNVAQVFLTDNEWIETLTALRRALRPGGYLVFETRDPSRRAWIDWTKEKTYQLLSIAEIGNVAAWCDVTDVFEDKVSFRWTYAFESDGKVLSSESTLRFRARPSIERSLRDCGYDVIEVREAPDRPGKEFVFIARSS